MGEKMASHCVMPSLDFPTRSFGSKCLKVWAYSFICPCTFDTVSPSTIFTHVLTFTHACVYILQSHICFSNNWLIYHKTFTKPPSKSGKRALRAHQKPYLSLTYSLSLFYFTKLTTFLTHTVIISVLSFLLVFINTIV